MSDVSLKLTYALKDGVITHISKVESGLACGCVCPACGEKLIAKKGNIVKHHFAHASGESCEYGVETALHLAAKEVIASAKEMMIPKVELKFPNSYKKNVLIHESTKVKIDHVEVEKRIDDIIPDLVVYSGEKKFLLEIFVTHAIDGRKLEKIKKMGISTIEIDLSDVDDLYDTELTTVILNDNAKKVWKFNRVEEALLQKYIANSEKLWITRRGLALHVDKCPKKMRSFQGKAYANVVDDCLACESLVSWEDGYNYVFCIGKHD